jgi:ABC-2 type transport system permease protein
MSAVTTTAAFVRRDWRIALSYRASYGLELVGTVFVLAMMFYIAPIVDTTKLSTGDAAGGYFGFATVGFALLRMVQTGLSTFATRLREEQMTGTLEAVMAAPAPPSLVVLASGTYSMLRSLVAGFVTIVAAVLVFGLRFDLHPGSLAIALTTLVACVVMFAALGVAVAAFTIVFKQTTAAIGLVSASLAILGGVYFPLSVLPEPLQTIGELLPFTWGVDLLRDALLGSDPDLGRLAVLAAFAAVAIPLALLLFSRALRYARRRGTLGHY